MVEAGGYPTSCYALVYEGEERIGDVDSEGRGGWERHCGRGLEELETECKSKGIASCNKMKGRKERRREGEQMQGAIVYTSTFYSL